MEMLGAVGSYLALIFWYFQGLITPLIAFLAVRISRQQSRTDAGRVKLELFDRRLKILEEVRKFLGVMTRNGDVTGEQLATFSSETMPAEFLMGTDIKEYLDEIFQHALSLHSSKEELRAMFESHASSEMRERPARVQQAEITG
jgi:hypothetical protein